MSESPTFESTAEIASPTPVEERPQRAPKPPRASDKAHLGTGRRKSSVARVRLIPGKGTITVNGRPFDKYFTELQDQMNVTKAIDAANIRSQYDVAARVGGGGHTGQSGAILLGVARAVIAAHPEHEGKLRDLGYLTRDARRVERKKYGRRKARRRFQFSKR